MLEAVELHCVRSARTLFRALSFRVEPGDAVRVEGPNGSGKTSLLRMLAGLLAPTEGRVLWKGEDVVRVRDDYAAALVYCGHLPAIKDELSAAENLTVACRIAGIEATQPAVAEALRRFGVGEEKAPVHRLSQGQRRRAALARLVLSDAARPLWLLDEPFAALDASGMSVLRELLQEHRGRGGAVVYTTHQDAGIAATRTIELG